MTRLSVRIPEPTAALLTAYQKAYEQVYKKSTEGGFIVNEILLAFFTADREFQEYLKKNPNALHADTQNSGNKQSTVA